MIGLLSLNLVACKRQKRIENKLDILQEELNKIPKPVLVQCQCPGFSGRAYEEVKKYGNSYEEATDKILDYCRKEKYGITIDLLDLVDCSIIHHSEKTDDHNPTYIPRPPG